MQGSESATVVIVEDDPSMSRALVRILRLGGIRATAYVSGEMLLASETLDGVGCLIVDVQLPEMSGFELRTRLATMVALPPVIFITAFDSPEARAQALAANACARASGVSNAVMKTTGGSAVIVARRARSSNPLISGSCTSSTRQPTPASVSLASSASPDT